MGRAKTVFRPRQRIGWWTLERVFYDLDPPPGRTGDLWSVVCRCGRRDRVTHEALQTGRSRACDGCARAYRAQHDHEQQLADLGYAVLGDAWAELYARSPERALLAAERRISAERTQLETFARKALDES